MVTVAGTFLAELVFHGISISVEKAYLMRKSNLHSSNKSEARGISKIQCFHQNDNISIVMQTTSFFCMWYIFRRGGACIMSWLSPFASLLQMPLKLHSLHHPSFVNFLTDYCQFITSPFFTMSLCLSRPSEAHRIPFSFDSISIWFLCRHKIGLDTPSWFRGSAGSIFLKLFSAPFLLCCSYQSSRKFVGKLMSSAKKKREPSSGSALGLSGTRSFTQLDGFQKTFGDWLIDVRIHYIALQLHRHFHQSHLCLQSSSNTLYSNILNITFLSKEEATFRSICLPETAHYTYAFTGLSQWMPCKPINRYTQLYGYKFMDCIGRRHFFCISLFIFKLPFINWLSL